jgi:8-oxo-dGTP pyrophosphatase MutT (NUDIX family)
VIVRSAGAIVLRDGRVLVIHRPKYDDWGFPKGKLEQGEDDAAAAVREVEEEVALRVRLGARIGETRYTLVDGTRKVTVFFRAEADGEPEPGDGVDEVRWVTLAEAAELLTNSNHRDLLEQL